MTLFAAVRVARIQSMTQLRQIESHGLRKDEASAKRVDPSRTSLNLSESRYSPEDPLQLVQAFKAFKTATGASEAGKNAALGLHVLCVVSPGLITEAGDLHNPNNPVNRRAFEQSQEWARRTFGPDSLVAARMDMDETGGGVVDLIVCPTSIKQGGRGRKPKLTISVREALAQVQKEHGAKRSYSALQDSWAKHARQHIDLRLQRGEPKAETGRVHVVADILRAADAEREASAQARAKAEEALKTTESLRAMAEAEARTASEATAAAQRERARLRERAEGLKLWEDQTAQKIDSKEAALTLREREVQRAEAALAERAVEIELQERRLATERNRLEKLAAAYERLTKPLLSFARDVKRWADDFRTLLPERARDAFDSSVAILQRLDDEINEIENVSGGAASQPVPRPRGKRLW